MFLFRMAIDIESIIFCQYLPPEMPEALLKVFRYGVFHVINCGQCHPSQAPGLLSIVFIMIMASNLPVALLLQAALCLVASAAKNRSIDYRNPQFKYIGKTDWIRRSSRFSRYYLINYVFDIAD